MKLLDYLKEEGVEFQTNRHQPVYTAQELAHAEHVPGRFVAKPVLVKAGDGFTLCVIPAPQHLDLDAVANCLCVKNVSLATEQDMAQLFTDCELGAEPPIGSVFGLPTLIDYAFMDDDYIVFQAGSHTESVRVARTDFERLADPMYGHITL